jgi:hypothetical protein
MRRGAVGIVLAILVGASLGVGYLAGSGARQTVTSSTTVERIVTSVATSRNLTVLAESGITPSTPCFNNNVGS